MRLLSHFKSVFLDINTCKTSYSEELIDELPEIKEQDFCVVQGKELLRKYYSPETLDLINEASKVSKTVADSDKVCDDEVRETHEGDEISGVLEVVTDNGRSTDDVAVVQEILNAASVEQPERRNKGSSSKVSEKNHNLDQPELGKTVKVESSEGKSIIRGGKKSGKKKYRNRIQKNIVRICLPNGGTDCNTNEAAKDVSEDSAPSRSVKNQTTSDDVVLRLSGRTKLRRSKSEVFAKRASVFEAMDEANAEHPRHRQGVLTKVKKKDLNASDGFKSLTSRIANKISTVGSSFERSRSSDDSVVRDGRSDVAVEHVHKRDSRIDVPSSSKTPAPTLDSNQARLSSPRGDANPAATRQAEREPEEMPLDLLAAQSCVRVADTNTSDEALSALQEAIPVVTVGADDTQVLNVVEVNALGGVSRSTLSGDNTDKGSNKSEESTPNAIIKNDFGTRVIRSPELTRRKKKRKPLTRKMNVTKSSLEEEVENAEAGGDDENKESRGQVGDEMTRRVRQLLSFSPEEREAHKGSPNFLALLILDEILLDVIALIDAAGDETPRLGNKVSANAPHEKEQAENAHESADVSESEDEKCPGRNEKVDTCLGRLDPGEEKMSILEQEECAETKLSKNAKKIDEVVRGLERLLSAKRGEVSAFGGDAKLILDDAIVARDSLLEGDSDLDERGAQREAEVDPDPDCNSSKVPTRASPSQSKDTSITTATEAVSAKFGRQRSPRESQEGKKLPRNTGKVRLHRSRSLHLCQFSNRGAEDVADDRVRSCQSRRRDRLKSLERSSSVWELREKFMAPGSVPRSDHLEASCRDRLTAELPGRLSRPGLHRSESPDSCLLTAKEDFMVAGNNTQDCNSTTVGNRRRTGEYLYRLRGAASVGELREKFTARPVDQNEECSTKF